MPDARSRFKIVDGNLRELFLGKLFAERDVLAIGRNGEGDDLGDLCVLENEFVGFIFVVEYCNMLSGQINELVVLNVLDTFGIGTLKS